MEDKLIDVIYENVVNADVGLVSLVVAEAKDSDAFDELIEFIGEKKRTEEEVLLFMDKYN